MYRLSARLRLNRGIQLLSSSTVVTMRFLRRFPNYLTTLSGPAVIALLGTYRTSDLDKPISTVAKVHL
jgi:hypothetical protein